MGKEKMIYIISDSKRAIVAEAASIETITDIYDQLVKKGHRYLKISEVKAESLKPEKQSD